MGGSQVTNFIGRQGAIIDPDIIVTAHQRVVEIIGTQPTDPEIPTVTLSLFLGRIRPDQVAVDIKFCARAVEGYGQMMPLTIEQGGIG